MFTFTSTQMRTMVLEYESLQNWVILVVNVGIHIPKTWNIHGIEFIWNFRGKYIPMYPSISLYYLLESIGYIWANYNISLTWNKAILGWFPLLTMIIVRSQWGRYNLPRYIHHVPSIKNQSKPVHATGQPFHCHHHFMAIGGLIPPPVTCFF